MDLLIFLLGTAFGIGSCGFLTHMVTARQEGLTVEIYTDLMHDSMLLIFILALLQVYIQL